MIVVFSSVKAAQLKEKVCGCVCKAEIKMIIITIMTQQDKDESGNGLETMK